jgi:hypothetical protein
MKKNILIFNLVILIGITTSCSDFLDVVPDNVATIEYAFRNRTSTERFLYTCYSYLPREGDVSWDVAMSGGDDIWTHSYINWTSRSVANAKQNVVNPVVNFWNGGNGADVNLWQGIRDCNIFLENINSVIDIPEYEKVRWTAEVKFLKAYYHFYLFRMYGPIPIVDENILVSAPVDEVKVFREPIDEVVNYITNLMLEAAEDLPDESSVIQGTEAGRINNIIAMSTRAEVYIFAASPLFNGNTNYSSLVDKRGISLFPQTYDPIKWEIAADACKEAIDLAIKQGKDLYDIVDPMVQNSPEPFWIQTTYRQAICDRWNKELIWGGTNVDCTLLSRQAQAKIIRLSAEHTSIRSEWGPTLKMVESYYSSNGVPINEDIDWIENGWFDNRYNIRPEPSSGDEKYFIKEGAKTVNLHFNREPRFYASLGFDKGIYFGNGYYDFPKDVKWTEFKAKEFSGMSSASECFSITGYSVKKMHSFKNAVTRENNSVEYYPFPVIRLADIYLYYAEALNEAYGPSDEVFEYLDAVRERSGLGGVMESWANYSVNPTKPTTKDGLREIIHAERNIELAFEGKRFWDIRRWKKISVFNDQPTGWNAFGDSESDFYVVTALPQTPVKFSVKDYFWPIREYDLTVNNNLVQNYGW